MDASPRERRPLEGRRDCLIDLLLDFWLLDLKDLPGDELEGWLDTVALCILGLLKWDAEHPSAQLHAARWLDIVTTRVAEEFPNYPGGPTELRDHLRRLMLQRWRAPL
jgi:hypothetical protein